MVLGQLHDERGCLASEQLGLLQHDAGEDDGDDAQEVEHGCHVPRCRRIAGCQRAEHERDDGHLGAARDHRGGHDGHTTVHLVLDSLGGHDGRHAATRGDEHGDERFTGQAELAEYAVHDERDAGHIAAQLQDAQQQEQDDHLRDEADDGADAGDDAVVDEGLQPRRDVGRFHGIGDDGAKTRDPQAPRAVGRIGLFHLKGLLVIGERDGLLLHVAVLVLYLHGGHSMRGLSPLIEVGDDGLRLLVFGHGVIVFGHGVRIGTIFRRLGLLGGQGVEHFLRFVGRQLGLLVLAQDVLDISHNLGVSILVLLGGLVERGVAGVEPAVAGDAVVGPVSHHAAADGDRQPVHEEHDDDEDGEAQPTVGDHAVDLLRGGQARARALDGLVHNVADGVVTLGGDDGLGVVIELVLDGGADSGDGVEVRLRKLEVGDGLVLGLEQLDGVPTSRVGGHLVAKHALDLDERFLDGGVELHLRRRGLLGPSGIDGGLDNVLHAAALQRRGGDDGATQLAGQAVDIDLVAVFLHQVHHVQRDNDRDTQVQDLAGQIQVALKVGGVDQVDDGVGAAFEQIIARHDLLGRIRGQRVDARQVRDGHVLVARVLALLLLDGHARPVANVLVGTRQVVEHRRLAAVRVAGKGNADSHDLPFLRIDSASCAVLGFDVSHRPSSEAILS